MTTALAQSDQAVSRIEEVLMTGNLANLSAQERVIYHNRVCESIGLNPLTRPLDYLTLNGKLVLYARKDATDQLRALRGISVRIASRERIDDLYVVTAEATDRSARSDESIGAVSIKGLSGENLANALMKAETKAKRRVTLSIAGLGLLDESEIEDAQAAEYEARPPVVQPRRKSQRDLVTEADSIQHVDTDTGEIEPAWSNAELTALLKGSGMKVSDLSVIVGPVGRDNYREAIDAWLAANPDKGLASLIGMAAAERNEVAPANVQPEMAPFE